ncbi:MAG: hypothetical protein MZV70_29170 [Desulfobacterales bacterium]|nr:hypothetical protein [Desulfobacterales bacterium]
MVVDWENMPDVYCTLAEYHPDYVDGIETLESLSAKPTSWGNTKPVTVFYVEDSREGWARAIEIIETAAYEVTHKDEVYVFDFSLVRGKGQPIGGMQDRPASGPVPTMESFMEVASVKGRGWEKWRQYMFVSHQLSSAVLVGGRTTFGTNCYEVLERPRSD